jgi:hypothetical protein
MTGVKTITRWRALDREGTNSRSQHTVGGGGIVQFLGIVHPLRQVDNSQELSFTVGIVTVDPPHNFSKPLKIYILKNHAGVFGVFTVV